MIFLPRFASIRISFIDVCLTVAYFAAVFFIHRKIICKSCKISYSQEKFEKYFFRAEKK